MHWTPACPRWQLESFLFMITSAAWFQNLSKTIIDEEPAEQGADQKEEGKDKEESKLERRATIEVVSIFTQTDEDLKSDTPPPVEVEVPPPVEVEVRETQVSCTYICIAEYIDRGPVHCHLIMTLYKEVR